jgi:hypothetical protein
MQRTTQKADPGSVNGQARGTGKYLNNCESLADLKHASATMQTACILDVHDLIVTDVHPTLHDHDRSFDATDSDDFLTALYCYFAHDLYSASN